MISTFRCYSSGKLGNIEIKSVQAEAAGLFGRLLIKLGFVNLGADRVICRLARRA